MSAGHLIVLLLLSLSAGVTSLFRKCCSPGEVFSGFSKVNCIEAPPRATQVFQSNLDNNVIYDEFPCQKPEHITTLPLDELNPIENVQLQGFCLEILYNETTNVNVPTLVLCNSNEDRDPGDSLLKPSPLSQPLNVRRCCLNDEIFNVKTGDCEHDDYYSRTDYFLPIVVDYLQQDEPHNIRSVKPIFVHRGLPECTLGAIFTYEIDAADISFQNGTLKANLSSGNQDSVESLTEGNSCLELTPDFRSSRRLVGRVCRNTEYCHDRQCVRKCCMEDVDDGVTINCSAFVGRQNFYKYFSNFTGTAWDATEYGVQIGLNCTYGVYYEFMNNIYGVSANGELKLSPSLWISPEKYCIDYMPKRDDIVAFICFEEDNEDNEYNEYARAIISTVLMSISCIFLLLTLIVYLCLPVLQNLHGKTLMCHVSSLLTAYFCLSVIHWLSKLEGDALCYTLGYILLFSFLSAFSWLNVMCFDIWQTFGRIHGAVIRGRSQNKRFALYCVYAWSMPIFITFLCIMADMVHILPTNLEPHFGKERCWFEKSKNHGEIIFFSAPVGIQLITNIVFFILTAKECNKVKAEINRVSSLDPRRKRFYADKTKFLMNVKLFTVMGISWIAEIVSLLLNKYTTLGYKELFYVTDVVNCLQGVFIFVLFVVKRRVHEALRNRLGHGPKKHYGISQANSTLQDPYKVKKSASNSTLTSSFAVSSTP